MFSLTTCPAGSSNSGWLKLDFGYPGFDCSQFIGSFEGYCWVVERGRRVLYCGYDVPRGNVNALLTSKWVSNGVTLTSMFL